MVTKTQYPALRKLLRATALRSKQQQLQIVLDKKLEEVLTGTTKKTAKKSATAPVILIDTKNYFTQLKLDTRTGQVAQVHYGPEVSSCDDINPKSLLPEGMEPKIGRFTLTPTFNVYTFLLLDQEDGRTWKIQWSLQGDDYRFIEPLFKAKAATAAGK